MEITLLIFEENVHFKNSGFKKQKSKTAQLMLNRHNNVTFCSNNLNENVFSFQHLYIIKRAIGFFKVTFGLLGYVLHQIRLQPECHGIFL